MIKQWSLKKIEISFFASTKRILNRNSLKNFVAYFYKLFDINLISRFPKPVQTTDLEISFFSKKKGKKKRKKEKEKIQRQVQKKKTVSPYLAHGTRVASSIKVSTLCRPQRQFAILPDDCFAVCCVPQKKRVPHPYWRRRGSSQGRREIGKG